MQKANSHKWEEFYKGEVYRPFGELNLVFQNISGELKIGKDAFEVIFFLLLFGCLDQLKNSLLCKNTWWYLDLFHHCPIIYYPEVSVQIMASPPGCSRKNWGRGRLVLRVHRGTEAQDTSKRELLSPWLLATSSKKNLKLWSWIYDICQLPAFA